MNIMTEDVILNAIRQQWDVVITSLIQILGDIGCTLIAANLFLSRRTDSNLKLFYFLISVGFIGMGVGDINYNYLYRIMHYNIMNSTGYLDTLTFVCFQVSQLYGWFIFIVRQKIKIFSSQNISYLLCCGFVIFVFIYFFYCNKNFPADVIAVQSLEVMVDMCIWLFAIICFAHTTSIAITFLTL